MQTGHRSSFARPTSSASKLMAAAPLFPVASGMIAGVLVDESVRPSSFPYVAVFAVAVVAASAPWARRLVGPLLVFAAAGCVGGILHFNTARTLPGDSVGRYQHTPRELTRVSGRVAQEPRLLSPPPFAFSAWSYAVARTVFLLDVERIEADGGPVPASGRVRVSTDEPIPDLRAGEAVEVLGWMTGFEPPRNPGAFDWAAFHRRQGVVAQIRCEHLENVRRIEPLAAPEPSLLAQFRKGVRNLLIDDRAAGSGEEAGLLEALILGQRSEANRRLDEMFTRAGCTHFLAASGTNVVIVMLLARMVCPGFLFRPRTRTIAMLAAVAAYALLADSRPPILRAGVIAAVYCIARLLGRHRSYLNWISASAVALAIFDPPMVFDAGYQLSFAATIGVGSVAVGLRHAAGEWGDRLRKRWFSATALEDARIRREFLLADSRWWLRVPRRMFRTGRRWVWSALLISAGAWLATLPIVAFHFDRVHLWGPVNTIILMPVITLVMALGVAKVVVTGVAPALGSAIAALLTWIDVRLLGIVETMGEWPGATLIVPPPGWAVVVSFYLFLLAFLWRFHHPARAGDAGFAPSRPPQPYSGVAASWSVWASLAVCLVSLVLWMWFLSKRDGLSVTVLSVGAGSAVVVELPDGKTILCDAGSTSPYDVADTIVPFLQRRGIRRVDRIFVSHPNLDHFSGVPGLIDRVPVGAVALNEYFERGGGEGSPSRHLLSLLRDRSAPIEILDLGGRAWEYGGATFEVLWPQAGLSDSVAANDTSTVLRISHGGRSVLLPGDIEDFAQRALLARGGLHADVLLLPHHGGMEASSAEFIRAVGAEVALRSSHQRGADTLAELSSIVRPGALYNTADMGAISVDLGPARISVVTARDRFPVSATAPSPD